jgi:hypothetical protein
MRKTSLPKTVLLSIRGRQIATQCVFRLWTRNRQLYGSVASFGSLQGISVACCMYLSRLRARHVSELSVDLVSKIHQESHWTPMGCLLYIAPVSPYAFTLFNYKTQQPLRRHSIASQTRNQEALLALRAISRGRMQTRSSAELLPVF